MENPCPYLRQRSDTYWEIVYRDGEKSRRRTTKTKDRFQAEEVLASFDLSAEPVSLDLPHLRRRTDGYWETTWKEDGKPRRKSHGTKIESEGIAAHDVFAKELENPETPVRPTVAWVVDQYYDYICREKAESTSGPMAANVGPLKEHLGHLFWDEVLQDTVDEYVEWRMSKPRWKAHQDYDGQYGTTSRNTACKDLRVLRAALTRARKNRYTDFPPDFSITEGEPVRDTSTWLNMDELQRMIAVCEPQPIIVNGVDIDRERDRSHIEGFLLIALATGARKEAILSLTWDQVYIPEPTLVAVDRIEPTPVLSPDGDWVKPERAYARRYDNPQLDFRNGTVCEGAYIDFGAGNGNKRRPAIPISDNWRLMNYLITADQSQPYVITYRGKPVQSLKNGLATVAKEAGVNKPVTHHTMKRTAITHMVRAGVPLNIVAEAVNTTEEIIKKHYSMHRPDIAAALGSALSIQ